MENLINRYYIHVSTRQHWFSGDQYECHSDSSNSHSPYPPLPPLNKMSKTCYVQIMVLFKNITKVKIFKYLTNYYQIWENMWYQICRIKYWPSNTRDQILANGDSFEKFCYNQIHNALRARSRFSFLASKITHWTNRLVLRSWKSKIYLNYYDSFY